MKNTKFETMSDVKINDQDKKCAPHAKFSDGSCYDVLVLEEIAKAYNKENPDKIIELEFDTVERKDKLNNSIYKKHLIKELTKRFSNVCTTQKCWLNQASIRKNIKYAVLEEMQDMFRPIGPDVGNEWLNTRHIVEVMGQYEKKYPEFKFLGAVPRDFQNITFTRQDDNFYKKLLKDGKTKVGIVYNTDYSNGSGEHWNACYADFVKGQVYFFDSYGVKPNDEVKAHIKQLENFIKNNCTKITEVHRNKKNVLKKEDPRCNIVKSEINQTRHQYKNSECGVYSMNFIIRLLRGDTFEKICNSKVKDDVVNKCRKVYFSKH